MSTKWMTTIVSTGLLEQLEREFTTVHTPDLTIARIKGCSEYKNFFSSDLTSVHTKVEILADETDVETVTNAIVGAGKSTVPGAGTVAAIPVEKLSRLHIESR